MPIKSWVHAAIIAAAGLTQLPGTAAAESGKEWLVITGARLVEGRDEIFTLNATLNNPTNTPASIVAMGFKASAPRKNSRVRCKKADKTETKIVRWQKEESSDQAAAGASGGIEIPVRVKYRLRGACSPYSIEAEVPLSESVPAGAKKSISLRLKEMPSGRRTFRSEERRVG